MDLLVPAASPGQPFNPLAKRNLAKCVADELLLQTAHPLSSVRAFDGAGIYVIYYHGDYRPYAYLREKNQNDKFDQPIYIGKAVPKGARRGANLDIAPGQVLFSRLQEHKETITQAGNLNLQHFSCRYLIVDDIFISLGESLLIATFRPVWNVALDGFGNHDPGAGRYKQKRSPWDMVHEGRAWALKCVVHPKGAEEWLKDIDAHFKSRAEAEPLVAAPLVKRPKGRTPR